MKLTGSLAQLNLDSKLATQILDKELKDILLQGTKLWVQTVASIVPIWSGMSQASIIAIASKVGISLAISPVSHTDSTGRIRHAPDRVGVGLQLGSATYNDAPPRYFFRWQTAVPHFIFNESNNANEFGFHLHRPGPYLSQQIAGKVFKDYVNQRLKRLDFNIGDAIQVTLRHFG